MTLRLVCVFALFQSISPQVTLAQERGNDLVFGQVYGSAGFLASKTSGTMTDAPATILVFASEDGHRNLVLTDIAGDYIALLQPGHYCIAAYTRGGKPLQLARKQLKCVDVQNGKDVRLDIMLVDRK